MKYSTLQKVMLTAMALVVSFAFSAQAGRPTLSSAKQTHHIKSAPARLAFSAKKAGTGQQSPMQFIYMLDDGTAEDSVGLTAGGDIICLNTFTVVPGSETIESVEIAWGTPAFPDPSLNGLPYTVAVWSDPNGDGSPTDAVLLTTAGGVVASQGTDTFISTDIPDTAVTTSKFFVGFVLSQDAGQFPAALDETAPTFSNVSWVAGSNTKGGGNISNLNANDIPPITIESAGLPGNWLIRATASGSPTPTPTPTATPAGCDVLWYNGDFNDVNGLANERDTSLGAGQYASVYDDFNVPEGPGWDVGCVFSNNLADTGITGASWEIRQGVSAGDAGTLIASGMTATPTVTPTGRSGFGFTEYMVTVDGLNVHLDPGTYWLNVTPTGNLTGRSFDSTTSGANCVGTPCGDNQNAFFDSNFFGFFFAPTGDPALGQPYDFSMGVGAAGGVTTITLEARAQSQGELNRVQLRWSPADGVGTVNVLRNGVLRGKTPDDGKAVDRLGATTGTFTYQVCETDTGDCSNEVMVQVP